MIKKPLLPGIEGRGVNTLNNAASLAVRAAVLICLLGGSALAAERQKVTPASRPEKIQNSINEALKADPSIALHSQETSLKPPTNLFYMNGANFRIDIEKLLDFPKFAIGLRAHLGRMETRTDTMPPNFIPHEAKGLVYLQKKF